MVSKHQNNFTFVCVGFIIGFVSGYGYGYSQKLKKKVCKTPIPSSEPEPVSEPEPEPEKTYGDPAVHSVNYFSSSYTDTYATLDELVKKPPKMIKDTTELTLRQKYTLMEDYSYIISLPYSQACRFVSAKGYSLRISSVQGSSQKLPSETYSSTTFGVEIRDPNYNFLTYTPSKDAVIVSIINVGPAKIIL